MNLRELSGARLLSLHPTLIPSPVASTKEQIAERIFEVKSTAQVLGRFAWSARATPRRLPAEHELATASLMTASSTNGTDRLIEFLW
jgi:hypothetical protein